MRKIAAMIAAVSLLLSGCSLTQWMDGSYHSASPHTEQQGPSNSDTVDVANVVQMRNALVDMIASGATSGILSVERYSKTALEYGINAAIEYAMQTYPLGAYAVERIEYELGTNAGVPALAVTVTYKHSYAEILRIKHVADMQEAFEVISTALDQCEAGVVLQIGQYEQTDFAQLIEDYADQYPENVMEQPQVTANIYPESGNDRIVELIFTYETSREVLRTMQSYVQPVFSAARLYVIGDVESGVKYAQLFAFLMERFDYQIGTSITPSYSLLRHGVGDSEAFARVYASMCRSAGLECMTVPGTREGEPWYWNIIGIDGVYYHVDLLSSSSAGYLQRRSDGEMEGYVWDYSAYPACGAQEETLPTEAE